ncbi:hypothetical protein NicSoilB8_46710 (plasmid) [Arthrobacter sp. NicSoilB8]|nr:hypothetical protein NicSoilB8_46710 [Arthrobacter sp. NicSoilB8]
MTVSRDVEAENTRTHGSPGSEFRSGRNWFLDRAKRVGSVARLVVYLCLKKHRAVRNRLDRRGGSGIAGAGISSGCCPTDVATGGNAGGDTAANPVRDLRDIS